eukprot:979702_1
MAEPSKNMLILTLGSALGNFLEFYSFELIGYFQDSVSNAFFPFTSDTTLSMLESFTLYGVSFIARPIGGVFFGYLGDKHGRINALRLSILMMSFPTFCIGCTPPFSIIGYWSTALVFTLRFIQGFAAGGEFASATIYIREQSPSNKTGLYLTLTWVLATGGILVLLERKLLLGMMGADAFNTYGFRIPFLLSILISVVAVFVRFLLPISQEFETVRDGQMILSNPIRYALKNNIKQIFIVSLSQTVTAMFYQVNPWIAAYLSTVKKDTYAYDISLIGLLIVYIPTAVLFGWICDKYNAYSVCIYSGLFGVIAITIIFTSMGMTQDPVLLSALQLVHQLVTTCFMIPFYIWGVLYLDDPRTRNTIYGFGYNISYALFVSYALDVCTGLESLNTVLGGLYVGIFCGVVLFIGLSAVYYGNKNAYRYELVKADTTDTEINDSD